MLRPFIRVGVVILAAASCGRSGSEGVPGAIVGSARTPVLVAHGTASTQERFERVVPVSDDGSFLVPASASAVIAFEDLDGNGHFSLAQDRPYFCGRTPDWSCRVARDRVIVRRLVDEDEATPPLEVHWLADDLDQRRPQMCHAGRCDEIVRHPRGRFTYSQVCDSMRAGTLRIPANDQETNVMLEDPGRPMFTMTGLERSRGHVEIVLSETLMRAHLWIADEDDSQPDDIYVQDNRVGATLPESCVEGACSLWAHVARLSHQELVGDVLVDYVDEIYAKLPESL